MHVYMLTYSYQGMCPLTYINIQAMEMCFMTWNKLQIHHKCDTHLHPFSRHSWFLQTFLLPPKRHDSYPDQKCVGLYVLSHRLTQGHARQSLHRNTALLIHTQQSLHQLASISRTCLCSLFFLGLLSLLWRHCSSSLQVNTGAVINCQTL